MKDHSALFNMTDTTVPKLETLGIEATLAQRGSQYGDFTEHARITQNIKVAMQDSPNWDKLPPNMKESLEMIAHKVGRILNGNPHYHDSWHDMVGYAKLVADEVAPQQKQQNPL